MPRLKSANFAVSELVSSITDTATSFQVANASAFPDEGPFRILVHNRTLGFAGVREIMEVGNINKSTNMCLNVLRGLEETSPVAHDAGARVECSWTAGTHQELADKADVSDLAGAGRTTETVKGNADAHTAHLTDYVPHFGFSFDTELAYDANGNLIQVDEKEGAAIKTRTTLAYDSGGNLIAVTVKKYEGANVILEYTDTLIYDVDGNLEAVERRVG